VRQRLMNIYETLVFPNKDLQIKPALSYSWGLIDDYTWEFKLRPNVTFHDGTEFTSEDVIESFNHAKNFEHSGLKETLDIIEKIEPIDDYTIHITTHDPDPLLLQRLSRLFIHPAEMVSFSKPIGTGPYQFLRWEDSGKFIAINYLNHWAGEPLYDTVEIYSFEDPFERVRLFVDGNADFLSHVPYDAVDYFEGAKHNLISVPSLEVQFLFFNLDSEIFSDIKAREMFSLAMDQQVLIDRLGKFVRPVNQFVSNGVFGFSPTVDEHVYDKEAAKKISKDLGLDKQIINFHLLDGLNILGDYVQDQLKDVGVSVKVTYMNNDNLQESIENGDADLYFMVYRADTGDAAEFFENVVHSDGPSNIGNYSSNELEDLLDLIDNEMDEEKRLFQLHEAMEIIVDKDIIGIPLFENETVYSFISSLEVQPRLDGLIIFNDIKQN
ncbi:ABC transporter substrate-binding protein, partial [Patescibacteria group bacterium]